ncbi:class II myosin [Diaporthe eres]|uniref:Class II myosin n=1 Tax=Diaporthe eres TaxID=83184 RepID=A0ABR1PJ51_DIAER
MENWDPSYPGENVNWYDEYIQRNAPVTVNWLQQPVLRDGAESTYIETRGVALYRPDNGQQGRHGLESVLAVSPLDDGSVCLWDVTGTKGRKGAICARSRPGILYIDGPSADNSSRSKRIDSGVTECVSVDSKLDIAFFAVQNRDILHMQRPGAEADITDEIYVAGRFPSILLYDRRMFPSIKGSLHSGARLSSLASLPVPFSTVDNELRREGLLSAEQIERSKTKPPGGRTLIACGEYNTKGSLEMYGLQPSSQTPTSVPGGLSNSVFKNRQSSSDSKLLSCINQGTRLVCSDGSGRIKWFERDGFTEVRRVKIGHCERAQAPSLFANMPGSDDIARKLLATQGGSENSVNGNDLLFWTGENLGLVAFTSSPAFTAEDFEEEARSAAELEKEKEERIYSEKMRKALERQADEVRFVRNLGLRV